jgi:hypothetical protein
MSYYRLSIDFRLEESSQKVFRVKEVWHEIFDTNIFRWINLRPLSIPLGPFQILTKSQRYFIFVSVIVSDDKFIASVNNRIFIDSQCNVLPDQQQRRTFTTTLMPIFLLVSFSNISKQTFYKKPLYECTLQPYSISTKYEQTFCLTTFLILIAGAVNTGE